ncbi:MAG: hypothetical protein HQL02_08060 [Nitrospirae bacterium]|nr:hypothetical protein [Nitrospirota bacterium]
MPKKIKNKHGVQHAKLPKLPHGYKNLSDLIVEYARPMLDEAETVEMQKQAIEIAIFCWKTSLLPEDERIKEIETMVKENKSGREGAVEMIKYMIDRRLNIYPDVNRQIMVHEVAKLDNGMLVFYLASTGADVDLKQTRTEQVYVKVDKTYIKQKPG